MILGFLVGVTQKKNLTIAVTDQHMGHILEVAQHLQAVGFRVEQIMDEVGIITGFCDDCQMGAVKNVEGVDSVEADNDVWISPPNAPLH